MADQGDEFECAIHLGPFEEPKLLDCHHTFCRKCLEDLAHANHLGNRNSIRCPLCTKISNIPAGGVKKFSTNFYLPTEPSSSASTSRNDKECCPIHSSEELKYFCEDCNTILCSTCLLGQHQNHPYLIIEDSKDVILENYKDQKDRLKRKLEELKKVKDIAEESLHKIAEHRQTALNSSQNDIQSNYDKNRQQLNTVLSKVNTQKSQIETTAAIDPGVERIKPIEVLRAVLIMKGINKRPSMSYFPPIQYLKFNNEESPCECGMNSVGKLENVRLSIPYTYRSNTWGEPSGDRPVLQRVMAVPGRIRNFLTTRVPPFYRERVRPLCQRIYSSCCGCFSCLFYCCRCECCPIRYPFENE